MNQQFSEQSPTTKLYPWDALLGQLRTTLPDIAELRAAHDANNAQDAHAALVESERRFRKLVQNSSDAITLVDAHGTVLFSNDGLSKAVGLPPDDRLGDECRSDHFEHPPCVEPRAREELGAT